MLGKAIKTILLSENLITGIIGDRLFPVSDIEATLPAVYYSVKVNPEYTKNGPAMKNWDLTLITMHLNYDSAWYLALALKETLDNARGKTNIGIKFERVQCISITDEYEMNIDSFGQVLEFEIITSNIASS